MASNLIKPEQATPPQTQVVAQPTVATGLTLRAILIGCVLSILLNIWAIHSSYVIHSSIISVTHLPVAALFPFVMVVLVLNPLLKTIGSQRAFNRQELVIIFFLVYTASAIPGWAFSTYWLSVISGPYYFAAAENRWAEIFFQYLPNWLVVPNYNQAIDWFYEGLPHGRSFPWQVWAVPLFWWSTFYLAIFITGASAMVMLRKQWVEHERLAFPLARVPLSLVAGTDDRHLLPPIARRSGFWVGFGVTLFIMVWNMVGFFGVIPAIPIGPLYSQNLVLAPSFPAIPIKFNFLVAGVAFFTNVDVLLSVWFFFLTMTIQVGIMNRLGVPQTAQVITSQHLGGFLVFVLFSLWTARSHLKQVFLKALGRAPQVDDRMEFFSYRKALLGFFFGLVYIVCWLYSSGMSLGIIAFLMGSLLLMYVGVTRIVAETGLVFLDLPYNAQDFTVAAIGSGQISPQSLTMLAMGNAYARNWRTLGMCSMAHLSKVGDEMGGTGKGVFGIITLTLVLSTITAVAYTLYLGYFSNGAYQFTEPAFPAGSRGAYDILVSWINNPKMLSGMEFLFLALGGIFTWLLIIGHHRFPWWPLHPIGFGVVRTPGVLASVFSIFVVWLVKAVLFKIGGVSLYRKVQPAVIGMLVAYAVGVFLSFLVDWIWFPGNGHAVHNW